jgi:hypothetical protein
MMVLLNVEFRDNNKMEKVAKKRLENDDTRRYMKNIATVDIIAEYKYKPISPIDK